MEHFIKNIEITNFKSIRHAEVKDCRRVNVFVGPPNVGKSNILEALSVFSYLQTFEIHLPKLIRLKGYSEIFNNGNIQNNSIVQINDDNSSAYFKYKNERTITCTISQQVARAFRSVAEKDEQTIEFLEDKIGSVAPYKFLLSQELKIRKYSFQNIYNTSRTNGLSLNSPEGENLFDVIELNKETKTQVKQLFNSYNLKLTFDKNDNQIKLLKALEDDTFYLIPFYQTADTLQRLIFYKAAILSNKNTVLLFEEPEAHCYEPYILEFTNSVKRDQNNNQFFIVTHSQYVIEELLRDEESRSDTNIYMVGLENNETQIKLLGQEMNKEIYQTGLNVFFNYQSLWNEILEHEAVH